MQLFPIINEVFAYPHRYDADRNIIDRVQKYLKVSMFYYEHHRLHTLFNNLNPTMKQDIVHDLCRDFFWKLPYLNTMPIGEELFFSFLNAFSHLYKRMRPSVGPSVSLSVSHKPVEFLSSRISVQILNEIAVRA